jgi:hypothetical protein
MNPRDRKLWLKKSTLRSLDPNASGHAWGGGGPKIKPETQQQDCGGSVGCTAECNDTAGCYTGTCTCVSICPDACATANYTNCPDCGTWTETLVLTYCNEC